MSPSSGADRIKKLMEAPRHARGAFLRGRSPAAVVGALLVATLLVTLLGGCAPLWPRRGTQRSEPRLREAGGSVVSPQGEPLPEYEGAGVGVPMIRVGLAVGVPEAVVTARGGYRVSVFAEVAESWKAGSGETWRFSGSGSGGGISVSGPGAQFLVDAGTIRVAPEGTAPLVFDGVAYRGELELFASGPGSLAVVNVLDLESYLRGVLPGEIGSRPADEIEAVKAQAVAARTYAAASDGRRGHGGFDVFATVEDQVYTGIDGEDPVCDRAILETAGQLLVWDGRPIHAYFHSTCGGRTEAREEVWELPHVPYLTQVWDSPNEDRFTDPFCSGAPNFTWVERWTGDQILTLVREQLPTTASTPVRGAVSEVKDMRVTVRAPSGRVRWLEIETDAGTYRVFGDRVRWLLRRSNGGGILRSGWFELSVVRRGGRVSEVVAEGRGYGHGVGMCQHGAMEMARRGYTYRQILGHYYPGATLARPAAEVE